MDYGDELFKVATTINGTWPYGRLPDPTRFPILGSAATVGNRILPTSLIIGAESQFHRWRRKIVTTVVKQLLDYRDQVSWRRQEAGIVDIVGRFFDKIGYCPALVWASPIWPRLENLATRAGLVQRDQTLTVDRYEIERFDQSIIKLRFASGAAFELDTSKLSFYYPEQPRFILRVPRIRAVYSREGQQLSSAYEEGLALGHPGEERELRQGVYTPNRDFHCEERGLKYLDLYSTTFAKLIDYQSASHSPHDLLLGDRFRTRNRGIFGPPEKRGPSLVRARFLRITFEPSEMRIVVILAAERVFERFLVEHAGLAELLAQRFGLQGK